MKGWTRPGRARDPSLPWRLMPMVISAVHPPTIRETMTVRDAILAGYQTQYQLSCHAQQPRPVEEATRVESRPCVVGLPEPEAITIVVNIFSLAQPALEMEVIVEIAGEIQAGDYQTRMQACSKPAINRILSLRSCRGNAEIHKL